MQAATMAAPTFRLPAEDGAPRAKMKRGRRASAPLGREGGPVSSVGPADAAAARDTQLPRHGRRRPRSSSRYRFEPATPGSAQVRFGTEEAQNRSGGGDDDGWGAMAGLPAGRVAFITHQRFNVASGGRRRRRSDTDAGRSVGDRWRRRASGPYQRQATASPRSRTGSGEAEASEADTAQGGTPTLAGMPGEPGASGDDESPREKATFVEKLTAHATGSLYGAVSVLVLLPVTLGYASVLVGPDPALAPILARVVSLQFLGNALFAFFYSTFDTATHASVGSVQDPAVMFFATAATLLTTECRAQQAGGGTCTDGALSAAILFSIAAGTVCTAVAFLALSFVPKLVQAVTYVPLPVVGGFLASIGAFILQGGLSLGLQPVDPGMTDSTGWVSAAAAIISPDNGLATSLSCGLGLLLFIAVRVSSHPAVLPLAIALPVPLFYAGLALSPFSMEDAHAAHMFFADAAADAASTATTAAANATAFTNGTAAAFAPAGEVFPPLAAAIWGGMVDVDGGLALMGSTSGLVGLLANMVIAVVVATLLLNSLGVETALGLNLHYGKELRLLAAANVTGAVCATFPGARNFTLSILTHAGLSKTSVPSRSAGFTSAAVFLLVYLFDVPILTVVPKFLFAGVLLFVAMDLLIAWLYASHRSMSRFDFLVVWVSFVAIQVLGLNGGMAVAVLASVLLFLVQYSRVAVIKRADARRANRFRLATERAQLRRMESAILLYRVEGVLFFATVRQVVSAIIGDLDALDRAIARRDEERALAEGGAAGAVSGPGPGGAVRRRKLNRVGVAERVNAGSRGGWDGSGADGSELFPARFVLLDCALLQGMDSSAMQTFLRLRRSVNARGVTLVLCSLPLHLQRSLEREGVITTTDPSTDDAEAIAFSHYDTAAEWCEDQLLQSDSEDEGEDGDGQAPARGAGSGSGAGVGAGAGPRESDSSSLDPAASVTSLSGLSASVTDPAASAESAVAATSGTPRRSGALRLPPLTAAVVSPAGSEALPGDGKCGAVARLVRTFAGFLAPDGVERFFRGYTVQRRFEAGDTVFETGTQARSIFFVARGHVVLVRVPKAWSRGAHQNIQSVTPGGIVGDLDVILSEERSFGCQVTEASVLYELTTEAHSKMEHQAPELANALVRVQLRDMCAHIKDVSFRRIIAE